MANMRRFFALLAIVTGLAAVGAPANAAVVNDVCQQVSSGESSSAVQTERCACEARRARDKRTITGIKGSKRPTSVVVYIPTVQFAADRAYE